MFFANFKKFASYWNEHEVHGDGKINSRNCLMVGSHSRCAFDNFYVLTSLELPFIASHFLFSIPGVASVFTWWGAIPSKGIHGLSSDEEFLHQVVKSDKPLFVLPGGAYEAYRSYDKKNTLEWKEEPGFARILANYANSAAVDADDAERTQIVPFYTKNGDSVFFNTAFWYTLSGYYARYALGEIAKKNVEVVPLLLLFAGGGMGFVLYMRPVKLDTYIGDPIYLKKGESAKALAKRVTQGLQTLIDTSNSLPDRPFKYKSSLLYSGLVDPFYGLFVIAQNLLVVIFIVAWIIFVAIPMFIFRGVMLRKKVKDDDKMKND